LKSGKEFSHGLNTDKHGFLKLSVKIRVSSVANKNVTQIPMENEPFPLSCIFWFFRVERGNIYKLKDFKSP